MDLVSEISYSNKTCNAKSENNIEHYVFRQEIAAYHNKLVYHENNLPTPKNADRQILGNPVKDCLENPSNMSSSIRSQLFNDAKQCLVTKAGPVLPLNYLQQTDQRIISPEHILNNNIKTQSTNRDHQGMVIKTASPTAPFTHLQQFNQTIIDPEPASCSRNPKRTRIDHQSNDGLIKYLTSQSPKENERKCEVAEKTTYCRPAVDMYSKQFIHSTVQKNARLQVLVKKLAHLREKEKQRLAWNNYINSLRNKHICYKRPESRFIPDAVPEHTNPSNSEIVENYSTRPVCTKSRDSQYVLDDYHTSFNYGHKNAQYHLPTFTPNTNGPNFTTNSQENSMMLNFELPRYDYPVHILPRYDYPTQVLPRYDYPLNTIPPHDYLTTLPTRDQISLDEIRHQSWSSNESHRRRPQLQFIDVNKSEKTNMRSVQTNTSTLSANSEKEISSDKSFQDKYKQENSSVEIIKNKLMVKEVEVKYSQLSTIDRKLDELIYSINNFIDEIKSQKHIINMTSKREAINQTRSSYYLVECNERAEIKCKTTQDRAISNISLCKGNPQETLYTNLTEEMHKSVKVKRENENITKKYKPNRSSSSLHITFDIPTKDGSIEIKDSFKVDPRSISVNEISEEQRMTIAVNTDPMGLLALFRVSAEAVKQLLSFVPSIDYFSYMSMLPLPAAKHMCHYVCNICGAAFDRPSQLSDHIQRHSLGRTRDCCVCRHVLDSTRQSGLFTCRHCGQKFTRAYCRELHQISCARALGKEPETSSSHLILR